MNVNFGNHNQIYSNYIGWLVGYSFGWWVVVVVENQNIRTCPACNLSNKTFHDDHDNEDNQFMVRTEKYTTSKNGLFLSTLRSCTACACVRACVSMYVRMCV